MMTIKERTTIWMTIIGFFLAFSMSETISWAGSKYPTKAIDIVLSAAAGSGSDLICRAIAESLKKELGVPVNLINRPGGGRIPAVDSVMKAATDGYTLLADMQASSSGQVVIKGWPYKLEERTYIAMIAAVPMAIVARGDRPWKSLDDLKNALKTPESGNLIWASVGRESTGDFALFEFFDAIGFDHAKLRVVNYKSSTPAVTAVAGQNGDFTVVNTGTALPMLSTGKIRVIAVTSEDRLKNIPDVRTAKEQGYPEVDSMLWVGFTGPKGLDRVVVETLNNALKKILQDPNVLKSLDKVEALPFYRGPAEFEKYVFSQANKVKKLLGK
jgi:tripartite-type tricarboxylate transporter receptor subunit TctC